MFLPVDIITSRERCQAASTEVLIVISGLYGANSQRQREPSESAICNPLKGWITRKQVGAGRSVKTSRSAGLLAVRVAGMQDRHLCLGLGPNRGGKANMPILPLLSFRPAEELPYGAEHPDFVATSPARSLAQVAPIGPRAFLANLPDPSLGSVGVWYLNFRRRIPGAAPKR